MPLLLAKLQQQLAVVSWLDRMFDHKGHVHREKILPQSNLSSRIPEVQPMNMDCVSYI
jgi:hypothetical protein